MLSSDLSAWTVDELVDHYRSGEVSPVEVARLQLDRVESIDPQLNAFVWVANEDVLETARESEQRWRSGSPLSAIDGVPATIKDLMGYVGRRTGKGSVHTSHDDPAQEDAPTTLRLREAGALILGATTTPEYGWKGLGDSPLTGITRNPWNTEMTSGGSSGGAGAAAAAGLGVLHAGSDGGGSIRMPAGFCGVFGLKPTGGLVPIAPVPLSGLLSHVGPMTRTVRDAAHFMGVVAQPDPRDAYPTRDSGGSWLDGLDEGVAGLRIAYAPTFARADVHPEIAAATRRAVERLASLGAIVEEVAPPGPDVRDAFLTLWDAAIGGALRGRTDDELALSDPGLVATLRRREHIDLDRLQAAEAVRGELTVAISLLLSRFDVIVSPQLPVLAFPVGSDVSDPATQSHWIDWTPFTYPLNMSRHPAAAVPIGLSTTGLPMSMQIAGSHFADRTVLRVARAYESVEPLVMPQLS